MKKPNPKHSKRIKRRNQSLRIKRKNANNKQVLSLFKKKIEGKIVVNDTVQPLKGHIWPNQAQPNSSY